MLLNYKACIPNYFIDKFEDILYFQQIMCQKIWMDKNAIKSLSYSEMMWNLEIGIGKNDQNLDSRVGKNGPGG